MAGEEQVRGKEGEEGAGEGTCAVPYCSCKNTGFYWSGTGNHLEGLEQRNDMA